MTVAPLMATVVASRASVPDTTLNAPVDGTALASSSSSKVTTSVAPLTAMLATAGAVVSAVVLLVTRVKVKLGTTAIALAASLSRFVPGV